MKCGSASGIVVWSKPNRGPGNLDTLAGVLLMDGVPAKGVSNGQPS